MDSRCLNFNVVANVQVMDDDVDLVTSNRVFCNACDDVKGVGYNELSVGVSLNTDNVIADGVYICQCGNAFVIQDNFKKDVYSFSDSKRLADTSKDDTIVDINLD